VLVLRLGLRIMLLRLLLLLLLASLLRRRGRSARNMGHSTLSLLRSWWCLRLMQSHSAPFHVCCRGRGYRGWIARFSTLQNQKNKKTICTHTKLKTQKAQLLLFSTQLSALLSVVDQCQLKDTQHISILSRLTEQWRHRNGHSYG
jgi:hypothetical protein